MTCPNCGKDIAEDSNYCTKCGSYLKKDGIDLNDYFDSIEEVDEEEAIEKGLLNNDEENIIVEDDEKNNENEVSELEEIFDNNKELDHETETSNNKEKKSKFIDIEDIEDLEKDENEKEEKEEEASFFKKTKHESESYGFKNDRLIEAFVGEDYKWIIRRPINIYALLLSWIYFLYRKMYIIGTIGLIITGVVIRFFPKFLIYYIPSVMIISGLVFNPIYKAVAKIRIYFINKKCESNDNFTQEELCEKYGGVNVIVPLIIFLIFLLVMIRTYYVFRINNENKKFWVENSENLANCKRNTLNNYKLLQENNVDGDFVDAVCSITMNNNNKRFNIYMKIKTKTQDKYVSFEFIDNKYLLLGATGDFSELQKKNDEKIITEEELEIYKQLSDIKNKYYLKYDKSKEEDELIKKKKNVSEKLNYIISKDDIFK